MSDHFIIRKKVREKRERSGARGDKGKPMSKMNCPALSIPVFKKRKGKKREETKRKEKVKNAVYCIFLFSFASVSACSRRESVT